MNFEKEYLYHIYNQGNNRQNIFFNRGNYLLFLRKMQKYITPYSDIIAWCLMPNHFHMMINVREVNISLKDIANGKVLNPEQAKIVRNLNDTIAILLRSYTRAINKAENRSGSLFRMTTKANCLNKIDKVSAAWFIQNGITQIDLSPKDYPKTCFDYIHQNPVNAGLVTRSTDWEFSSAKDYASIRDGKLVNKIKAEELGVF